MRELENVYKGVSLVYYGLYLIIGSVLVIPLAAVVAAGAPQLGILLLALIPLMIIGGTILGLVGRIMCLGVPQQCAATGVIYAAVACDVTVVLLSAASWFVNIPPAIGQISRLFPLAATIFFLIFLKKVAAYISDTASEKRAVTVLILCVAAGVTLILGIILTPLLPLLLVVVLALVLIGFVIYVGLLISLKESLRSA